jgi:hypothetical protein
VDLRDAAMSQELYGHYNKESKDLTSTANALTVSGAIMGVVAVGAAAYGIYNAYHATDIAFGARTTVAPVVAPSPGGGGVVGVVVEY